MNLTSKHAVAAIILALSVAAPAAERKAEKVRQLFETLSHDA